MSNLYKIIDSLCAQNGTNITQMCKALSVSRSTLSELKSGRTKELSHSLMLAIAEMFYVDVDFFNSINYDEYDCPCGARIYPDDSELIKRHSLSHSKWINAVKQYGFCWNVQYREYVKAKARSSRDDLLKEEKQDSDKIAQNYELIFKALFSRSLEAHNYSLEHPDFKKYCSGMLGQKRSKDEIPAKVHRILTDKYGMSDIIPKGTYYMPDIPTAKQKNISKFTNDEKEHIKKYRTLDEYGKRMIDLVLDEEYNRCTAAPKEEHPTIPIRHSTYKVSAGRGFDLDDRDSWEEIDIPDTPEARKADFAVTIIGDSMEPIYSDGQIVLVREQAAVDIGETGIYIVNGGGFIKINGGNRLISINPEYDDIFVSEGDTVSCAGKVIGVV